MNIGVFISVMGFILGVAFVVWKIGNDMENKCDQSCLPYKTAYCKSLEAGCYTADEGAVKVIRFKSE